MYWQHPDFFFTVFKLEVSTFFFFRTKPDSAMNNIKSSSDQTKAPECNAYEALWNRHEQSGCPEDLILHIEDASGRKRTFQEFRSRVVLAATALDESLGVQYENGEMIAIISHSSSVRVREGFLSTVLLIHCDSSRTVLHLSILCSFLRRRSFCSIHAGHLSNFRTP